ncbi:MAG: 23S rRNA (adenine(2503)-C(2))-methyltransferase RlmN [Bacteroidota bacterium]|nr:23S rRNA (adenine(2503)-C(2))-methyltransferase RlmN [Bacteroidota bacterium]
MKIEKQILFGKTLSELQQIANDNRWPKFIAKQITDWLYKKDISSIDEMSNLSKKVRSFLSEHYELGLKKPVNVQESVDGTKKYLYPAKGNNFIEAAYIPDRDRATLCVSTQVGCKMACDFCMTGKQGFQSNLSAAEIVNQVKSLPEKEKLTNIVYMGMGEPLDNPVEVMKSLEIITSEWGFAMSPRRITVSTIGIIPAMIDFLENSEVHLAVSLHTPFAEERRKLMPVQNAHPIQEVINTLKRYDFSGQRRISFEYIMFKGINDQTKHVKELSKLVDGLKCRINLIRFHKIPDSLLEGCDLKTMEWFRDELNKNHITTTIRASRGEDIFAACGLLSTKEKTNTNEE